MADSRKRKRDRSAGSAVATATKQASGVASMPSIPLEVGPQAARFDSKVHRRWLNAAMILAFAWGLSLLVMCAVTSNPVVLSRPQVAAAEFVVTGVAAGIAAGGHSDRLAHSDRLTVEKVWRGEMQTGEIRVANLPQKLPASRDGKFIVPLSRFGGRYRVTTLETQAEDRPPLVYPATPEVVAELVGILRER